MPPHTTPNDPKRLNALVHNVIWPAVAGSILWAMLQLAIDPSNSGPSRWPGCVALLAVGVYLAVDWVSTNALTDSINSYYWLVDIPLAASLSTFAIATQLNVPWAGRALAVAFVFAIIGHLAGAWDPSTSAWNRSGLRDCFGVRATLAGINLIGLGVLFAGRSASKPYWWTSSAIALVVFVYLTCNPLLDKWQAGRAAPSHR